MEGGIEEFHYAMVQIGSAVQLEFRGSRCWAFRRVVLD